MAKERFSFDDTIEFDKDELTPNNDLYASNSKKDSKFVFNDDNEKEKTSSKNNGDKKVKKNGKKKRKIKIWMIVLLAFIAIILTFILYIFVFAGNSDGPVYGDRCASILTIDKEKLAQGEAAIEANEQVSDVEIEVNCRTIKMTYTFVDNISSTDAMSITESTLHSFDDTIGLSKDDGAAWSQLFNKANGRMQYDVDIILKSNGDENFPVFGVKHAGVDAITYTGQNVKDQSSTDRAVQRQAEVDAANAAQGN